LTDEFKYTIKALSMSIRNIRFFTQPGATRPAPRQTLANLPDTGYFYMRLIHK
jgi:hypothetical protein